MPWSATVRSALTSSVRPPNASRSAGVRSEADAQRCGATCRSHSASVDMPSSTSTQRSFCDPSVRTNTVHVLPTGGELGPASPMVRIAAERLAAPYNVVLQLRGG